MPFIQDQLVVQPAGKSLDYRSYFLSHFICYCWYIVRICSVSSGGITERYWRGFSVSPASLSVCSWWLFILWRYKLSSYDSNARGDASLGHLSLLEHVLFERDVIIFTIQGSLSKMPRRNREWVYKEPTIIDIHVFRLTFSIFLAIYTHLASGCVDSLDLQLPCFIMWHRQRYSNGFDCILEKKWWRQFVWRILLVDAQSIIDETSIW